MMELHEKLSGIKSSIKDILLTFAAVAAVTYADKDTEFAMRVYKGKEVFSL